MTGIYALIGHGTPMDIAWWQMCVRAVIIFAFGIALLRVAGRRAFGRQSAVDIVLAVLIGSNLSRALTGGRHFSRRSRDRRRWWRSTGSASMSRSASTGPAS